MIWKLDGILYTDLDSSVYYQADVALLSFNTIDSSVYYQADVASAATARCSRDPFS